MGPFLFFPTALLRAVLVENSRLASGSVHYMAKLRNEKHFSFDISVKHLCD